MFAQGELLHDIQRQADRLSKEMEALRCHGRECIEAKESLNPKLVEESLSRAWDSLRILKEVLLISDRDLRRRIESIRGVMVEEPKRKRSVEV